ncbi:MAG TPA: hypothetical protein VEV43_08270 [Actinomycetota bacterium]|nr:hypothetical protein [Actinomycetota bacterium]
MRRPVPVPVWQLVAGAVACCVLGWFAFVRGTNVPVLALADLGFHELGHLLTYVFPDVVTAMMGSITQVAVPWGLAAYFFVRRGDFLGGTFCLAWAGTAAHNASVYVADAPWQTLELIGGSHDWAFEFGPYDAQDRAADVAGIVRGAGLAMLLTALAICLGGLVLATGSRARSPLRKGRAVTGA